MTSKSTFRLPSLVLLLAASFLQSPVRSAASSTDPDDHVAAGTGARGTSGRYLFLDHLPPFLGNQIATLAEFLWLGYQTERTVVLPLQWKALYGETVGQLQAYVGKWTLHDLAVQRSAHKKVAPPPHPLRVEWVERMDLSDHEQKNGDTRTSKLTIPMLDLTAGQLRDGPMRFAVGGDAKARGMFSSFFRGDPEFYRGSCAPAVTRKTEGKEGRADVEYVVPEAKNPAKVQPVYGPRVEITTITEDDLALGLGDHGENKSRELLPHQFAEHPCIGRDLSEHAKGGRVALSMRAQTTHTYYQYKRACFIELLKFHPAVSQQKFLVLRQTWHAFSGLWEPEDVGGGSAGGEKEQRKAQEDNMDKLNLRSDPEPVVGRQFVAAFFAYFYRNTLERMFVRPYVLAAQARKHRKAEIRARRAVARASRGKVPVKCGLVVNGDDTTLGWHNCKPQVEDVGVAQNKAVSVLPEAVPATQPEPQRAVLDFVMEFFLTQKVFAVHLRSMTRLLHPDEILSEYQKFATLHQVPAQEEEDEKVGAEDVEDVRSGGSGNNSASDMLHVDEACEEESGDAVPAADGGSLGADAGSATPISSHGDSAEKTVAAGRTASEEAGKLPAAYNWNVRKRRKTKKTAEKKLRSAQVVASAAVLDEPPKKKRCRGGNRSGSASENSAPTAFSAGKARKTTSATSSSPHSQLRKNRNRPVSPEAVRKLKQEFVLYLCTDNADSDGVAALAEFLRTNYNFDVITSADTRDWARAVQLESDAALLEAVHPASSTTSRDRYGAAPDFHLFFELFLVSISQLLLGSPWSSLFWLMRRFRDHVVAKKILLHRTIDEVTCDGRLRSGALQNADPWLVFCGRGGRDEEDGEVGELTDDDTLHHVEDAVRPFYEQLGYRVSPSSSSSSAGNAQQQGHVGPLEDENGTEILVAVAERQKLSHVRWDEILDEGGSLQQTSGSFRTLNTLEMFGDVDAGSIFPTSFYVFDLWSWMRNLSGLLRWAHEAETNDLERVFGASSGAGGAGGKGSSSFSTSNSAPASTSALLASGSDSDAKQKWPEFLPFRGWSEDSQEKSVANLHVKNPSPHFDRRVRVVLKMREDSTSADGKSLTLEKIREVGHRVLGSIAKQLGVNVDSEAINYRDHLFGVEGNKAVDDVKPVESPEILVDETLPSPDTLFGAGASTTAGRKNKLQLDFSLGELVVALWNQESFVRTEGDASFAWLLYLKYIALFVTEGNYTEKECRQEVGTFAHATWLFFWVYTREHEKVAAAAEKAKSSSASSASAGGSVEIRGTIYRLLRIWREPATRYLETVWRYLAAFRCQPQFLGPTGEFVDASRNVRGEKEFAAFANRVAAEYSEQTSEAQNVAAVSSADDYKQQCSSAQRRKKKRWGSTETTTAVADDHVSAAPRDTYSNWSPHKPPVFERYNPLHEACDHSGLVRVHRRKDDPSVAPSWISVPVNVGNATGRRSRLLVGATPTSGGVERNWLWCGAGTGAGDEDGGRDGNEACADAYRIEDARSEAVDFASLGLELDAERPANYHNFLKKVQQLVRWDGYAAWSYGWKN